MECNRQFNPVRAKLFDGGRRKKLVFRNKSRRQIRPAGGICSCRRERCGYYPRSGFEDGTNNMISCIEIGGEALKVLFGSEIG